jgi:hypothetical protein
MCGLRFTFNQIAGLIRDHPDWFELPKVLRRKERKTWRHSSTTMARHDVEIGDSYSYDSDFEKVACEILHWSLQPNTSQEMLTDHVSGGTSGCVGTQAKSEFTAKPAVLLSTHSPKLNELQAGDPIVVEGVSYSIVSKLGAGSWAVMYEAVSTSGRQVAIKCMREHCCAGILPATKPEDKPAIFALEFEGEVDRQRRAAALGVAPAVIGVDACNRIIVMEYLHSSEYTRMSNMIATTETPLSDSQQLALMRTFATLKRAGITCRDTNFLLNVYFPVHPEGCIKVTDCGKVGEWNIKACPWKSWQRAMACRLITIPILKLKYGASCSHVIIHLTQ